MNNHKIKLYPADLISPARYILVAALLIYVGLLLRTHSAPRFSELSKQLTDTADLSGLTSEDGRALRRYYGLNAGDYKDIIYYHSRNPMEAGELLLVHLKNTDQSQEVIHAVRQRVETQKQNFHGYAPKQERLIQNHIMIVKNSYILFAISDDADRLKNTFIKAFD